MKIEYYLRNRKKMSQLEESVVRMIYAYYSTYRTAQCPGCVYNYLSQRDHSCHSTYFDIVYFKDTLEHFEELGLINHEDALELFELFQINHTQNIMD